MVTHPPGPADRYPGTPVGFLTGDGMNRPEVAADRRSGTHARNTVARAAHAVLAARKALGEVRVSRWNMAEKAAGVSYPRSAETVVTESPTPRA